MLLESLFDKKILVHLDAGLFLFDVDVLRMEFCIVLLESVVKLDSS